MNCCKNPILYQALFVFLLLYSCSGGTGNSGNATNRSTDPLPSWKESASKNNILQFVKSAISAESDGYIPVSARIAVFDNDGTLWSEKPAYFQLYFAIDRIREMAVDHPEWENEQPFEAVLKNDMETLASYGEAGLLELVMKTHAGMSTEEFTSQVTKWAEKAIHPTKKVPYTHLYYQPMIELLNYLRENDFKTYIVSGGGVDFMRALVQDIYGIPSEQIIGSTIKTSFDYNNRHPVIRKEEGIDFIDDKEGKPININKIIGKRPVFCAGNSDGDLAMMEYTALNPAGSMMLYIHHTDSVREWAYDRNSHVGRFDKALDSALHKNWTIVDMEKDWKVVFPEDVK